MAPSAPARLKDAVQLGGEGRHAEAASSSAMRSLHALPRIHSMNLALVAPFKDFGYIETQDSQQFDIRGGR
jgi:hypothetical protein